MLSALKNYSLSELKDAINFGSIIGEGGSCKVYKVINMLDIKNLLATMYVPTRNFVLHTQYIATCIVMNYSNI